MRRFTRLLVRLYSWLTRLYPAGYQAEFADEMQEVFAELLAQPGDQGPAQVLALVGRELGDLPGGLIKAYGRDRRQGMDSHNSNRMGVLSLLALIALAIAAWWGLSSVLGSGNLITYLFVLPIPATLATLALALAARKASPNVWFGAGLLILAGLLALQPAQVLEEPATALAQSFLNFVALMLFVLPALAVIIAALLLYSGLNFYAQWRNAAAPEGEGSQAQRKQASRAAGAFLGLCVLLLAETLHYLYWLTIWDNTNDPLGYLWLVFALPAGLFSGALLSFLLPSRLKLAGFLYALLVPALLVAVSAGAQGVDFRQLTEERAGQVSQALESYHAREGRYPQSLQQLTPGYLLSLPGPVILYGQDWCYDGGGNSYRLGYVSRQHWSDPNLFGQLYTTIGLAPDLPPLCEREITAIHQRNPQYYHGTNRR